VPVASLVCTVHTLERGVFGLSIATSTEPCSICHTAAVGHQRTKKEDASTTIDHHDWLFVLVFVGLFGFVGVGFFLLCCCLVSSLLLFLLESWLLLLVVVLVFAFVFMLVVVVCDL